MSMKMFLKESGLLVNTLQVAFSRLGGPIVGNKGERRTDFDFPLLFSKSVFSRCVCPVTGVENPIRM